ncbi:MAG TPA: hypothetical protein VMU19_09915 [Bryobacteraceae bacterium]|nr:hypothetical protein [Bryobacteraceae bacterium]
MACQGECIIIEATAQSVDWEHNANQVSAQELAKLKARAIEEHTTFTKIGCPKCWCERKGKPSSRITHEFVVYKVVLPSGADAYVTGWVTVLIETWQGDCQDDMK